MLREIYQCEQTMQYELRERLRYRTEDSYLTAALGYWLLRLGTRLVRSAGGQPATQRIQARPLEQWRV